MGGSGPVDVCVREGASECMRGFVYSHMHAHRVYGRRVRAGACVHIRVKCVRESVLVYLCVYMCVYKHTAYTMGFVCFVSAALDVSVQTHVCMSICVCRGDIGLYLLWRRMATCPCMRQLQRKLRCKWWPHCWRPTRLVPALHRRYEEGNVGAASGVLPVCMLCKRQAAACVSHAHA